MAVINPLPEPGDLSLPWYGWLTQAYRILFAAQQSGTTANRPTTQLWTGRPYFDTTLTKPIWYDGSGWVDATGASV